MANVVGLPPIKREPATRTRLACGICECSLLGLVELVTPGEPLGCEVVCLSCGSSAVLEDFLDASREV